MTMTVGELRTLLEDFSDDMEVKFSYNYGDYGRTQVAASILAVEELPVVFSGYHSMDRVLEDDTGELVEDENQRCAVIISGR